MRRYGCRRLVAQRYRNMTAAIAVALKNALARGSDAESSASLAVILSDGCITGSGLVGVTTPNHSFYVKLQSNSVFPIDHQFRAVARDAHRALATR